MLLNLKSKSIPMRKTLVASAILCCLLFLSCSNPEPRIPSFRLVPTEKFLFKSFVDCNMAEAWIADTFRIFPGKHGEDTLWGYSDNLRFGDGRNADEAFSRNFEDLVQPQMPPNYKPGAIIKGGSGLDSVHGAVWFETVYQDSRDASGKTLYAVYHNENYPWNFPYNPENGEGYIYKNWPVGLTGPKSPAAVCRIGIMKSENGGHSWSNKGIFIEDLQPRLTLLPHNTSKTFAGGVGDPSAVASGDYLYLFYGEYGYPGVYDSAAYDQEKEWSGQCISVARIAIADLDKPEGKAKRWDGKTFNAAHNSFGSPIPSLQIPLDSGGGAASVANKKFHWGPSVSWNTYLNCWVMMMGRVEEASWRGSAIFISFNFNKDLGAGNNSQQWTRPKMVINKPGHIIWYPSLQPMNTPEDIANKHTCLRLGKRARLFYKDQEPPKSEYLSEYIIEFER